ncbi:FliH/SctL family protein [Romboutsia sp.]|uniref:FliH/SctL family protein n=1 Tax=Romboutsia sp. TaxID=1965302 RepID=UPI003F2DFCF4
MMNSFYSSVIKKEDAVYGGKKKLKINTQVKTDEIEEVVDVPSEELIRIEEEIQEKLAQAELKYEETIKLAQEESLRIIEESKNQALDIEKKAYEEGHSQGVQNGYEDGYKEAYEDNIEKARTEADEIINNANNILFEAKEHVTNYIKEHQENIMKLSISIAEQALRSKFEDVTYIEELLLGVINEYELKENFVIKVNSMYKDSLDKQVIELKENYRLNGDVFVLEDDSIEAGNVIIDTVNGRLVMGIDAVLDKIKEELL